ncbi:MAG: bifunctional diaminohydroxyphosphoribosylaminopyrimidine deaminase/5-amino-6-(5-phosphoribosylamino)uracil reductase RibD [Desulfuromonadales bacterium]|nr:bifunctional diaminohydroxyphosphoribosylaminopyrimidine deaminase/5-amino-6-(5-phosphoribosylamino)uracil reductase RibD [Desulfuromonadales bacterium]
MARAIELARRGEGRTAPNPPVGAVLVRDGVIVGEGWHPAAGEPHAEIYALRGAGEFARGADLYVTLEPCCHQGRTGPCTEALVAAGVRRVFFGAVDPNPRVAGRGLEFLQRAGVEVAAGPLVDDCRRLIAPFAKHVITGRPYVILKAAMTIDGQLATSSGESRWISGAKSRELVHRRRDRVDGILTGSGTVLTDNPQLTVRLPDGGRNPARIVLDGQLRTSPAARVYSAEAAGRRLLVTAADLGRDRHEPYARQGVEVLAVPRHGEHLDLSAAMTALGGCGLQCLMVEGGGILNGALLRAGMVDRVMLFLAPLLLGGSNGKPLFVGDGVGRLADALRLNGLQVSRVDEDLLLEGEIAPCSPD